ncbi:hypothetical protein [Sideroxydans sp. CL21]|uniref:hypothetical protein n=1 Tax=Sideroxydans sp. CL21 TaxID=2600596 RepID=UPI0024BD359A|nr:hypothetical protein [Sideroxydans sp. CL21]
MLRFAVPETPDGLSRLKWRYVALTRRCNQYFKYDAVRSLFALQSVIFKQLGLLHKNVTFFVEDCAPGSKVAFIHISFFPVAAESANVGYTRCFT